MQKMLLIDLAMSHSRTDNLQKHAHPHVLTLRSMCAHTAVFD